MLCTGTGAGNRKGRNVHSPEKQYAARAYLIKQTT
jgi:hypothetical protein